MQRGAPSVGLVFGIVGGVLAILLVSIVWAALNRDSKNGRIEFGGSPWVRRSSWRYRCDGNLKQIGLALLMYSGENDGWFPPVQNGHNFEPLNTEGVLNDGRVYGCVINPNRARAAACSDFVYLGSGLRDGFADPTIAPLAYCPNYQDHYWNQESRMGGLWTVTITGDGHPVLFTDGHVEWLTKDDPRMQRILRERELPSPPIARDTR